MCEIRDGRSLTGASSTAPSTGSLLRNFSFIVGDEGGENFGAKKSF